MKLLTSTALSLLLISLVGCSDSEYIEEMKLLAEQGSPLHQWGLGRRYANGDGVSQNNVRAYVWWSVAAALGNEDAKSNRDIMADRLLTPEQLARGQDMATSVRRQTILD